MSCFEPLLGTYKFDSSMPCYEEPTSIIKRIAMRDLYGDLFWHIYDSNADDYTCSQDERYKGIDFSAIERTLSKIINRMVLDEEDVSNLKRINILIPSTRIKRAMQINGEETTRVPGSFVVLSDFHAHEFPIDKIEDYYLNEYDCIYILGDATDRGKDGFGTNGIEYLLRIKELTEKYPNRVIYVPGNHDQFLMAYVKRLQIGKDDLLRNGGRATIDDLDKLQREDFETYKKLIDWLGNLPIQRVHEFRGQKYVLAHALFNQSLYDRNKEFCLNDIFNAAGSRDYETFYEGMQVIWFRKGQKDFYPDYDINKMPSSECIMVIGHTPPYSRNVVSLNGDIEFNFDLIGSDSRNIKVYCVDAGVFYNGNTVKKYDGGSEVHNTKIGFHTDTSPQRYDEGELEYKKTIYHDYIIGEAFDCLIREQSFSDRKGNRLPKGLSLEDIYKIIEGYGNDMENLFGFEWPTTDFYERKDFYEQIFLFDYIISCTIEQAVAMAKREVEHQDYSYAPKYSLERLFYIIFYQWLSGITSKIIFQRENCRGERILNSMASVITRDILEKIANAHYCDGHNLRDAIMSYIHTKFSANILTIQDRGCSINRKGKKLIV